ncbi:MAG: polysaccharide deacetylase family protein [Paeniclostridium sordellii]|uniref:Polysaccharide deacetylase n=1 Tax=Paeniclostridium hominis TaxID=2764329 RepID=A0ABR7K3V3_9FIRM|nr:MULTISPECIES: polysaccharide deacetylase family protein [Paeniclostridium]MBC6003793.1 polysaccharide deacetylase [Paeniclostridium hominis]MBC8632646.1 polysaccharide deacetylase [[Eubacterium] tenue]MDU1538969.1 polysaccharide deacetylase family protein [Paeniclostridium sordellii]MDU2591609.1 polysaccharide deacetylase family protein [Paeniclostridium sordellii]
MKKNIFENPKNKNRRRKVNIKRAFLLMVACLVIFGSFNKVKAYVDEAIKEKQEQKIAEQKRLAEEEKKRKEAEEAKKKMIGVKHGAESYSYSAKKVEDKLKKMDYSNNGEKIVFLTFDDGTSTTVTPQILKTLKDENVKATFFLTGQNIERGGEKAKELIKQEFEEGHAIANHSYSHDYGILYPNRVLNLESFKEDFKKTDDILKDVLGPYFSTEVIRCPGGHMSWKGMQPLDKYLDENGIASIDWNALSGDAEGKKKNPQELYDYAVKTSAGKDMVVVLMHDTYGKENTAKALPQIIKYFKDNGYQFKVLV